MVKVFFCLLLFLSAFCNLAFCQGTSTAQGKEMDFLTYSLRDSALGEPPYGLQKIKNLMSTTQNGQVYYKSLDKTTYNSLSVREKFTYNIIHPESYSQTCTFYPVDRKGDDKIFAQLPGIFEGFTWSDWQWKFFLDNKDSVVTLMKGCISKDRYASLRFERIIVYVNAKQMTPEIISIYIAGKRDQFLLTVLMLLMNENKYPEFISSKLYKKLYGGENFSYQSYIDFNEENEQLILKYATNFYKRLSK